MKTVKTPKGTILPLINLKGKDYMMTAYRLQWFVEENTRYTINTEFVSVTSDETLARVTINLYDTNGNLVKSVQGSKRESKKDFNDHSEKAETGALGRALISLGYGTQYALSDLDEGSRIVDSPVTDVKPRVTSFQMNAIGPVDSNIGKALAATENLSPATPPGSNDHLLEGITLSLKTEEPKKSSFRKPRAAKTEPKVETAPVLGNGSTKEEDFFNS